MKHLFSKSLMHYYSQINTEPRRRAKKGQWMPMVIEDRFNKKKIRYVNLAHLKTYGNFE